MIARHYFSHYMPGGGTVFDILDRRRVPYVIAGENLATNNYLSLYPLSRALEQSNADLMHSPGHRANILNPNFQDIGIGVAEGPGTWPNGYKAPAIIWWTTDFGSNGASSGTGTSRPKSCS